MQERREYPRIDLKTRHLDSISFETKDRIIDISLGGCKILSTASYAKEDSYELKVINHREKRTFIIEGYILRIEEDDDGFITYGVKFDNAINQEKKRDIDEFITTRILKE